MRNYVSKEQEIFEEVEEVEEEVENEAVKFFNQRRGGQAKGATVLAGASVGVWVTVPVTNRNQNDKKTRQREV